MTYTVNVTREGDNWLADVPEVPGAHTNAHSLEGLRKGVREVIVLMADLADDADPDVVFEYDLSDGTAVKAAEVGDERDRLASRDVELQCQSREFATALVGKGYSHRDTAVLLHMTPGRVTQLVKKRMEA